MQQQRQIAIPPASDAATRRSMKSNRRADTKPEVMLRSMLHRVGLRFRKDRYIRLDRRGVKADIVFVTARVVVFMDGCFWHRCPEHGTMPSRNHDYWLAKFQRNVERDGYNTDQLQQRGWQVIRIWEHEVKDQDLAAHAVERVRAIVKARTERVRDIAAHSNVVPFEFSGEERYVYSSGFSRVAMAADRHANYGEDQDLESASDNGADQSKSSYR